MSIYFAVILKYFINFGHFVIPTGKWYDSHEGKDKQYVLR
jgi:hypothetical protein